MIPILQLKTQYDRIRPEIEAAVRRVLESTHYVLGPEVEAFEHEFADWNGSPQAVGVGSGTEALHLAVRALDIGPGDEVICPAFTFAATAGAIALAGAAPVFAEAEERTFGLDAADVERRITPRTKAIVAVHLYGHPADMGSLLALAQKHGLAIIEDCAQATGATWRGRKVGTIGEIGCYSFFPSKNLGGIGDGGMVLTSRADLAEKVRLLRGHGSPRKYHHTVLGTNSRLDEIQAAALRVKLQHLDEWNEARRRVAAEYDRRLAGSDVVTPPEAEGCRHVYHQYTLRTSLQEGLMEHLKQAGIGAVVYYPISLHLQEAFAEYGEGPGSLPVSERLQAEVVSLPMFPELTEPEIARIAREVSSFAEARVSRT